MRTVLASIGITLNQFEQTWEGKNIFVTPWKLRKTHFNTLFIVFTFLLLASYVGLGNEVFAAEPSIMITAAPQTVYNGGFSVVTVKINSSGKATNAYRAVISYPRNIVRIISSDTGGSVCSLWPQSPTFDNDQGTAVFECGLPSPGYNSDGGVLAKYTFRAIAVGTARISVAGGSEVYANDATGSNIIGGKGSVNIRVIAPPPPAIAGPVVKSSTNPDENVWYSSSKVFFSWSTEKPATGYSYEVNQVSDFVPDDVVDSSGTTLETEVAKDGIWYFHIKYLSTSGWSQTTHYKIQIDTTPPLDFTPELESSGPIKTPTPKIFFNTTDTQSGIDRYEVRIDGGEYSIAESPFVTESLSSGRHIVTVAAYDAAGNVRYGKNEFYIYEVAPPYITTPDNGKFVFGEEIMIEGESRPDSKINIYLNSLDTLLGTVESDSLGKWSYSLKNYELLPGSYEIFTTAVDEETGIMSALSNVYHLNVSANAMRVGSWRIPWWGVLVFVLSVGSVLVGLLGWLVITFKQKRKNEVDKLIELKRKVHKEFDVVEELVEDEVDKSLKKKGVKQRAEIERDIEKRSDKILDSEEKKIQRAIDEIIKDGEKD